MVQIDDFPPLGFLYLSRTIRLYVGVRIITSRASDARLVLPFIVSNVPGLAQIPTGTGLVGHSIEHIIIIL